METNVLINEMADIAYSLQLKYTTMNRLDALLLAVQIQKNKIEEERNIMLNDIKFVLCGSSKVMGTLEAIAKQLGYKSEYESSSIVDALNDIASEIPIK